MAQQNQPLKLYQFRVGLLRTSPHIWRRLLLCSTSTLADLDRAIRCTLGWAQPHRHEFVIRGSRFDGDVKHRLTEFCFRPGERFYYDVHSQNGQPPPAWRHQIRLEKEMDTSEPAESYPRCAAGRGSPPLDQVSSAPELASLAELFTPGYVVHRLTEMVDSNCDDGQLARELRHLRPWLELKRFRVRKANQRLRIGERP